MIGLRLSPRAQADIASIWDYTVETFGRDQAVAYLRLIDASFAALRESPLLGRDAAEIKPGLRKIATGSHMIYYRPNDTTIDVVRVLHKRMDASRHF